MLRKSRCGLIFLQTHLNLVIHYPLSDEAQKDLGWLVCRHHDGVGAGVLCPCVYLCGAGGTDTLSSGSRDRESRVIWPKGQGDLPIFLSAVQKEKI